MAERDEQDRQTHENLQAISQHLEFPPQPNEQKRVQWQALLNEPRSAPRIVARGAKLMKRHKFVSMIGGGALAAGLLLAVFVVSTARTVSASVILMDLRLALQDSILVHFQNIVLDYAHLSEWLPESDLRRGTATCSGSVFVSNRPAQQAFWVFDDIRLSDLSTSAEDNAGFSAAMKLTACLREESPWFFLQLSDVPSTDPPASGAPAAVLEALRGGLYVTMPSLEFETGDGEDGHQVQVFSPDFANLRDLQRVLGRLEEMASDITVEETEPGLFVLTATGFQEGLELAGVGGVEMSQGIREGFGGWLRDMMMAQIVEVGYREEAGVRWIRVRRFGSEDGRIDIALANVEFDRRLFELDYHIEEHAAPVVDASTLLTLMDLVDGQRAGEGE